MNGRHLQSWTRRRKVVVSLSLVLSLTVTSTRSHAGILRDVMEKMHISKPEPPKPGSGLPRQGFACCVLHYKKDTINDGNYAELPLIPAGTPVEVTNYGSNKAYIKIEGKPMQLKHDYGRDQESLDVWVNKVVVDTDPRPRIAGYPKLVQEAIREGKVVVGMTKEQAIVAVGYPLASENVTLDAPMWRIWRSSSGEYDLHFGPDNRIKSISGDDAVTREVIYQPGK